MDEVLRRLEREVATDRARRRLVRTGRAVHRPDDRDRVRTLEDGRDERGARDEVDEAAEERLLAMDGVVPLGQVARRPASASGRRAAGPRSSYRARIRPARRRWTPSGLMRTRVRSRSAIGQGLRGREAPQGVGRWVAGLRRRAGGRWRGSVAHARRAAACGAAGRLVGRPGRRPGAPWVSRGCRPSAGSASACPPSASPVSPAAASGPSGVAGAACAGTTDDGSTGSSSSTGADAAAFRAVRGSASAPGGRTSPTSPQAGEGPPHTTVEPPPRARRAGRRRRARAPARVDGRRPARRGSPARTPVPAGAPRPAARPRPRARLGRAPRGRRPAPGARRAPHPSAWR